MGVWTTPDPIGILGGINVYSYVKNNPVNRLDLLGLHTGGYGGPEKGDEMANESIAEGPSSMNDSHSSFYDKYYNINRPSSIGSHSLSDIVSKLLSFINHPTTGIVVGTAAVVIGVIALPEVLGASAIAAGIGLLAENGVKQAAEIMGGDTSSIPNGWGLVREPAEGIYDKYFQDKEECEQQ